MTIGRRADDVDVNILGGAIPVPEEQGDYECCGHYCHEDNQGQRKAGEAQVVARADLFVEEQSEPAAAVPKLPPFRDIPLIRMHI